ncbi:MAG: polyketide synthase dehydratase domain-containing protein [Archangium sp.]|nr:polyketide synthase dehydratase domain-containing protein [Archangium sp.]
MRSPKITAKKMQFLHEVTEFNPTGGPWGRGYLRAETPVTPNDWFFEGHFKNDPCMPGTLMFEGCLQAMSIYLAGLGFTIERDSWRFEPVPDTKYPMRCRGQVTPQSKHLVYEVFVSEVSAGPIPTVWADLLCTVDGRKAFHAKRVGLQLVPDWPMETWKHQRPAASQLTGELVPLQQLSGLLNYKEPKPVAVVDGFAFDYHSLLACAWGPPSSAFGPFYARFDGTRRAARLPGPPYHFMSRITKLDGPIGGMKAGTTVEVEYDLPVEQWYFEQNGHATMPFCVLMEAALQPCGWLASYVGSALTTDVDLLFRNLDGTGTQTIDILPGAGTFRTKVKLLSISQSAGMIIESFDVECFIGDTRVFDMKTVFGFFPKEAFENQVGLPASEPERARLAAKSDYLVDLTQRPAKYCDGTLRLAGEMLLMLDRVTGFWPEGGEKKLGYLRAEKTVDVDEWFFKAHFFQDPVQPGSLGIEAISQLVQFFMLEKGMGQGLKNPRFEPIMLGTPITWKYRGQVTPKNKLIGSEIQITEIGEDAKGRYVIAEGWLWVDNKRIYHAKNLGMRIVEGPPPSPQKPPQPKRETSSSSSEDVLDPSRDTWLSDHRPTWTLPALPMMSMVDRLAGAVERETRLAVTGISGMQVRRWLPFPGDALRVQTEVERDGDAHAATFSAWRESADPSLSRFEPVASGTVHTTPPPPAPAPLKPLADAAVAPNPYASGALFHGPAFQYLTELRMGPTGASATLRAEAGTVPHGTWNQGLLDAATHAIPHDALSIWSPEISKDVVGYPYRLSWLHRYEPLPTSGPVQLEVRFAGFDGDPRFPSFDVQLLVEGRVAVAFRLVEVLLPKGPIGQAPREARRRFLRDRQFTEGVALSSFDGTTTKLTQRTLRESDWLPGNLGRIYGIQPSKRGELLRLVAEKEHVSRRAFVHPALVTVDERGARADVRPLRLHPLEVAATETEVQVRDAAPPVQDLSAVRAYWSTRFGVGSWPVEDVYYGLIQRFVGDVVLADPDAFARVHGRSCLYVGNHQVGIESLMFSVIMSALSGTPTVTLAKAEHRTSWLGTLIQQCFSYPGVVDPRVITYFDRDDKAALLGIVSELGEEMRTAGKNVMVHVEGTRSLSGRQPVVKMSSAFIDMALAVGAPIVPVRFVGGLPVQPLTERIEFPVGHGAQDIWVGSPIMPETISALPLKQRKDVVLAAMNALGPPLEEEVPLAPKPDFAAAVNEWHQRTGASVEDSTLFVTLALSKTLQPDAAALVEAARLGHLQVGADAKQQWLGRLAQRLFGPKGPRITGLAT